MPQSDEPPTDLVPRKLRGLAKQLAATQPVALPTPLPLDAAAWYGLSGCWSLALALHDATGLPIEVLFRSGEPKHALVVDGDSVLDACARHALQDARSGFDEWRGVTAAALLALLAQLPNGEETLELIDDADVRSSAERTARFLLAVDEA